MRRARRSSSRRTARSRRSGHRWPQTSWSASTSAASSGRPGRENSVKQMISRVADTIAKWGREGGYFATETDAQAFQDELTHLLLHQKMSFNSPVWFNLGVVTSKPQISACQPYDARVATPNGLISIGDLVARNAVGEEVFDRAGVTRIVATKSNGRKEVFRLTVGSGVTVDATADHVILVADDRRGTHTSWKRVSEVRKGDRLVLDASRTVMRPIEASVAELAGMGAPRSYAGRGRRFEQQGDVESWVETAATEPRFIACAEAALAGWLQGDGYVGVPVGRIVARDRVPAGRRRRVGRRRALAGRSCSPACTETFPRSSTAARSWLLPGSALRRRTRAICRTSGS